VVQLSRSQLVGAGGIEDENDFPYVLPSLQMEVHSCTKRLIKRQPT
jgi:hypothetical protein